MINILFIAYFFPPIGGAPTQRSLKFVRYLLEEGYRSIVISGPGKTKMGYVQQDQALLDEIPTDISIYRTDTKEPPDREGISRKIQRLLNLSRPFAKWWINEAIKLGEIAYKTERPDLIYATMSPFESANVASYLSQKLGIPWVADLRDAWTLDEIQAYPSLIHRKVRLMKMRSLLSTASVIVMNTPEATACLKRTFSDFYKKQLVTITNGFDPSDLNEEVIPRNDKKFRIVHVGHFLTDSAHSRRLHEVLGGATHGVDLSTRSPVILFKAIEKISQGKTNMIENLEIIFVGNASGSERGFIENSKLSSVCQFTGYMPRREALKVVRTADLLFLPMHNLPLGKRSTSAPSKMYEYMASGRPILAAVPEGDARDFLAECGTAFLCRPDDCDGMIRILKEVHDSWGKGEELIKLNREFLSRFERKRLAKLLASEFDKLLMQDKSKN